MQIVVSHVTRSRDAQSDLQDPMIRYFLGIQSEDLIPLPCPKRPTRNKCVQSPNFRQKIMFWDRIVTGLCNKLGPAWSSGQTRYTGTTNVNLKVAVVPRPCTQPVCPHAWRADGQQEMCLGRARPSACHRRPYQGGCLQCPHTQPLLPSSRRLRVSPSRAAPLRVAGRQCEHQGDLGCAS